MNYETDDPFVWIAKHNLTLIRQVRQPDFDGYTLLDPTFNQAERYIHLANEKVVTYPQGAFPLERARAAIESTYELLDKVQRHYGGEAIKPMAQKFRHLIGFWYYEGYPIHPPELFTKKIFCAEEELFTAMQNANRLMLLPQKKKRRGRSYGDRDPRLHRERAEVVREMRNRKRNSGLSWAKIAAAMRQNSAYSARMRGRTDATWIRYAKAGFSG